MKILKGAQSFLEYSLLLGVLALALMSMQFYLKRSMQDKILRSGEALAEPYSYGSTQLYERYQSHTRTEK